MKQFFWIWCVIIAILFVSQTTSAYTLTNSDINVTYDLSERLIDRLQKEDWNISVYEKINQWITRARNIAWLQENHKAILDTTNQTITNLYQKSQNDTYFQTMKTFRATYNANFQTAYDQPAALVKCFEHYPLVDAYARITNKPTPLLLAMWYAESTCGMNNPANRDWLFQIVSNDYEPGPITRASLQSQLADFAKFMDNKRTRYYSRNKDAPRDITYTSITYDAMQTFAALYNGIDLNVGIYAYPLLNGNPYYFLGNYNADYTSKKDWLLVFFIKLSKMEADYFGK